MESIKGRANDFIVLPNGKLMASCFLVIIMQPFHGIAQYRIIQDRKDRLLLQFVKGKDFDSSVCEKIKHEIKKATGGALRVDIEILDGLPRDGSGKIRTVVSELVKGALPHHFERF